MIKISGRGETESKLPIGVLEAQNYFADLPAFLNKIEAVSQVRNLSSCDAYLVSHHPVGAFNYQVELVTCMKAEWLGNTMRLIALDFDKKQVRSKFPVVKGFSEGTLNLQEGSDGKTHVQFSFEVEVELPLPVPLQLLPRPLLSATADGIMQFEVNRVVRNLFNKVLEDFGQTTA